MVSWKSDKVLSEAASRANGPPPLTNPERQGSRMAAHKLSPNAKTSKLCKRCLCEKPADDFYKYRYICKPCTIERVTWRQRIDKEGRHRAQRKYYEKNKKLISAKIRKYRQENREKHLESARKTARKRRLELMGTSEAGVLAAFKSQRGKCAICQTRSIKAITDRYSHIDHCHSTGMFRGILCNQCNTGLGRFSDDPEILRRAADYVAMNLRNDITA